MIELKNVRKSFGERVLFKNLNLTIPDGEFAVLIGASGCGKTTLLDIIAGIEPIDSGEVLVDGVNILKRRNRLAYYQTKLGMCFQNFALIENMTVRKNLELVQKKSRSEMSLDDALHRVGMTDYLDKKVCTLSGGEQQRIALARLMVKKCSIVLADEPTGSLDADNAAKVMAILSDLNAMGKTVVMVTHDTKYQKIGTRQIDLIKMK
ncbi:ATP-binding cassette domain-containing protein [Ruminococcus sp.]|uniref:ABC transporter ATP-binding protein n=1 Tax=Ruminococcus sp. TaxID=41978 RepID=UPI001B3E0AB8|nr:ATP-binding cassette domain-containing protein [Ruminococcus sp.]MBP5433777.1 ATP-binding cassette domain-containing protein [Ruminococcus sp.]